MNVNAVTFPSRIDAWLVAVLLFAVLSPLAAVFLAGANLVFAAVSVLITVLVVGLLLVPCRYTLEADHLLIRCGLIRQRIVYRDITDVTTSNSVLSAPALSLKRVKVSYGGGPSSRGRTSSQLVSPRDREVFIHTLRERVQAAHTAVQ